MTARPTWRSGLLEFGQDEAAEWGVITGDDYAERQAAALPRLLGANRHNRNQAGDPQILPVLQRKAA